MAPDLALLALNISYHIIIPEILLQVRIRGNITYADFIPFAHWRIKRICFNIITGSFILTNKNFYLAYLEKKVPKEIFSRLSNS
jgi:hypothetical protein